jgi:hypothetical protein
MLGQMNKKTKQMEIRNIYDEYNDLIIGIFENRVVTGMI